jgi:hypothetical protein
VSESYSPKLLANWNDDTPYEEVSMADRPCQRPGCDRQIPSFKRRHARWCSRSCENKARRSAARLGVELENYGVAEQLLPEEVHSLAELHGKSSPPHQYVSPDAEYVIEPDHLDDDKTILDSVPGHDAAGEIRRHRADVTARLDNALEQFEHTIRVNYQGSYELAAQRDPRIRAIVDPFTKEFEAIDAAELRYMKADAMDQANRPWNVEARRDRARGIQATTDFSKDLGRPSRLTGGAPEPGRATDDLIAGYPGPGGVFGTDTELFKKSGVARNLGQRVYSPDGFVF